MKRQKLAGAMLLAAACLFLIASGVSQAVNGAAPDRIAIHDGRTSFERVRRVADSVVLGHDEYVIVDRAGRMQLPPELLQRLKISGRARVHLADDHIEIWPDKEE